jgi:hypothetical protein
MPTINTPSLTHTIVGVNVTLTVTYNAVFTAFERQLAGLGMTFHEHLDVFGIDPPGSLTGTQLATFPLATLAVTAGAGPQTIARSAQMVMTRAALDEDPAFGNPDEISVKIRIHSIGLPPPFTPDIFTNEEVLP